MFKIASLFINGSKNPFCLEAPFIFSWTFDILMFGPWKYISSIHIALIYLVGHIFFIASVVKGLNKEKVLSSWQPQT